MKKNIHTTKKNPPPIVLIILDGFGLAPVTHRGNAITPQTASYIFGLMEQYPSTSLIAHGEEVGLFHGQSGNSEAGHFNIGAGRVVEQDLYRISKSIKDGTFFKNTAFEQALYHAEKYRSKVHIVGLLTDSNSPHARDEHLFALLEYFKKKRKKDVYLHLFTDGRDSPPHAAIQYLQELRKHMNNDEKIASIMGRLWGMDRNKNWDRTEKAYDTLSCGEAKFTAYTAEEAIAQAYNRGETDEYISPTIILDGDEPTATIDDNDIIVFFNARSDRARQLTKAFVQEEFVRKNPGAFKRKKIADNIRFVAMTDFGPDLDGVLSAFPSPDIENCLAKAIGENRRQLYISETEKYAHVTFFLNGGYPEPINGESRYLVRSSNIKDFSEYPQMESKQLTESILSIIHEEMYDFICINFPNADMVGHTGNIQAAKEAVVHIDECVEEIVELVLKKDGIAIITADHGNAEEMINEKTGEMMTAHTTNPVPFIIVGNNLPTKSLKKGKLADIAPTLLKLLGIKKPKEMTGRSLF